MLVRHGRAFRLFNTNKDEGVSMKARPKERMKAVEFESDGDIAHVVITENSDAMEAIYGAGNDFLWSCDSLQSAENIVAAWNAYYIKHWHLLGLM